MPLLSSAQLLYLCQTKHNVSNLPCATGFSSQLEPTLRQEALVGCIIYDLKKKKKQMRPLINVYLATGGEKRSCSSSVSNIPT